MNRILMVVVTFTFLLGSCDGQEKIDIRDAWARPAAQGGNGAVYFVIGASEADEIIRVSSDTAEAVEMHESMMSGDVMEMHPLESVPLHAGEEITFEPGGLHIMLIDLKQDLKNGDEIKITLHFKNHEDIQLSVPVQDSPASAKDH